MHMAEGVALRMTSVARTIVDCFKYCNKIGPGALRSIAEWTGI